MRWSLLVSDRRAQHPKLDRGSIVARTSVNFWTISRCAERCPGARVRSQFGQRYFLIQDEMIPILNIVGIKAFVGPFHLFGSGELDHDLIAVVQPHVLRRNLEPLMKQRFELCHGLVEIDHFFSHVLLLVNDFHLIKKINAFQ